MQVQIKLKQQVNDTNKELHLIGVAEIHYWHGFDRLVKGLADYYDSHPNYKVFFHIVGDFFGQREKDDILPIIKQHKLENYVTLHGAKHGEELDRLFEKAIPGNPRRPKIRIGSRIILIIAPAPRSIIVVFIAPMP